ncbi:MAG: DUF255 domain-containing protein [Candidatus Eisenbacteria bacterium]|nr:DUF255 domain-containing protein [Candidatus Eisenbacteria bacterium]
MPKRTNRLAGEQSPYLLQHATNPVDWYPWGEAAFERARSESKPLFISIGYAACHWCHVMERESFEDPETAALLNGAFVCVKVDREERPDVDRVYMDVAMMMTGRGGWPLTVIASPDGTPFFAATYIPRESRFGSPGLKELVPKIVELYRDSPREIDRITGQVRDALRSPTAPPPGEPDEGLLALARDELRSQFDERNAGFGEAPKFPSPHQLMFLLRWWKRTGDRASLNMTVRTLDAMGRGGIHDHLEGGFHRYSTDDRWHLPHFEKMLYDQALIALASAETFQATGEERFAALARTTLRYVVTRLGAPDGGFFCSEDADSEGGEGRFYLWSLDEVRDVLGEEADILVRAHGLTDEGNAVDEATGKPTGANVLGAGESLDSLARSLDLTTDEAATRLEHARVRLLEVREQRARPPLDDKVLTDWNGLIIASLAFTARATGEPDFAEEAERAASFILSTMRSGDRLLHRYRNGDAGVRGNLDDYAFLVWGLMELHAATQRPALLDVALELTASMLEHFSDPSGGFHFTPDDGEKLVARPKEIYDGALPSGNSVAVMNLARLARLTGRPELEEVAIRAARSATGAVRLHPSGYGYLLCGIDHLIGPTAEVVIAGRRDGEDTRAFTEALNGSFLPRTCVLVKEGDDVLRIAPWARELRTDDGRATAAVCRAGACGLPVTEPGVMMNALTNVGDSTEG